TGIIVSVKKFALVAAAAVLVACSKDIQNKEALKQAVIEYLDARATQTGLDPKMMEVDVSGMSFEQNQARATVVFRPKGSTEGGAGMTMSYTFDRKGDKWVVRGRQDSGANPHGSTPLSNDARPPSEALPPGHPSTK